MFVLCPARWLSLTVCLVFGRDLDVAWLFASLSAYCPLLSTAASFPLNLDPCVKPWFRVNLNCRVFVLFVCKFTLREAEDLLSWIALIVTVVDLTVPVPPSKCNRIAWCWFL